LREISIDIATELARLDKLARQITEVKQLAARLRALNIDFDED
jgi:hypothetical protein